MSRPAKPSRGIEVRHQHQCQSASGNPCDCRPKYRAIVTTLGGKKIQKTFSTIPAAKQWREDMRVDLRRGRLDARSTQTVRQAAKEWLAHAKAGTIRNRSGNVYKPSALRGYEQALRDYVLPELGAARLSELRRRDVQVLVDRLVASGLSASTTRNALLPLRAISRRALLRGDLHVNPTHGLELPAQRGRRDRVASPQEAAELLGALPVEDRPLWACAMYAGLRLGELQALLWDDVDLEHGLIHVRRSWDRHEGVVDPKSAAGFRSVPIVDVLGVELEAHRARRPAVNLAFGREHNRPFSPSAVVDRACRIWRDAGLTPISPHECRHTFATIAIAAGVNIKALQTFMGHASITITLDRYGHVLPGSESEAAAHVNRYLANQLRR
jgi:integrase